MVIITITITMFEAHCDWLLREILTFYEIRR
jgi:hypothetical protein